jgi:hypothetical protein
MHIFIFIFFFIECSSPPSSSINTHWLYSSAHACMHASMHPCILSCMRTCVRIYVRAYVYTYCWYTYALYVRTYIHTREKVRRYPPPKFSYLPECPSKFQIYETKFHFMK